MVKIFKFLIYLSFFFICILFFLPKVSLYHYGEKELVKHKIVFSQEAVVDNGLFLELSGINISYEGIQSAKVETLYLKVFALYNSLHLQNIQLEDIAVSFVPIHIESLDIEYSVLNPLYITGRGNGEFGKVDVRVSILDKNVSVILHPSSMMQKKYMKTLKMLQKESDGSYTYAKTF